MAFYDIRTRPDGHWDHVQVAGREFVKGKPVRMAEGELTDEIRNSPLLEITVVPEELPRPPARELGPAEEEATPAPATVPPPGPEPEVKRRGRK